MLAIFPPDIGQKIERIFAHVFKEEPERTGKIELWNQEKDLREENSVTY